MPPSASMRIHESSNDVLLRLPGNAGAGDTAESGGTFCCASNRPGEEKLKTSAPDPASTARRETTTASIIYRLPHSPTSTWLARDGSRAKFAYACRNGTGEAQVWRGFPPRWRADFSATVHARA